MKRGGLARVELYDRRFDWLVVSLVAIPAVWLFYGFDAAFACFFLFLLIGALKPLVSRLGSRIAAGLFAAGVILFVSPLLRYVFYNGFCYDGAWSVAAGISRYQAPDLCPRGWLSNVDQELWIGPLRDMVMPVAGIGLIAFAWLEKSAYSSEYRKGNDVEADAALAGGLELIRWSGLIFALVVWGGMTALNYRQEQIALDSKRRAENEERARQAAAAAEEARKLAEEQAAEMRRAAAERAAKQVQQNWLVGNWVNVEDRSASERSSIIYCETDNDLKIKRDGHFEWFDERGKFRINGNTIRFFDRTRQEYGEPDAPIENIEDSNSLIERDGSYIKLDGEIYARCK